MFSDLTGVKKATLLARGSERNFVYILCKKLVLY